MHSRDVRDARSSSGSDDTPGKLDLLSVDFQGFFIDKPSLGEEDVSAVDLNQPVHRVVVSDEGSLLPKSLHHLPEIDGHPLTRDTFDASLAHQPGLVGELSCMDQRL